MKTTYFLGAGFSRDAGLPLMNDFFYVARDIYNKMPKDDPDNEAFGSVFDFYRRFSRVKNVMNCDLMNIEELLSIIEMEGFIKGRGSKRMRNHCERFIARVINDKTPEYTIDTYISYLKFIQKFATTILSFDDNNGLKEILRYPSKHPNSILNPININIISLNYDLLIETIFREVQPLRNAFSIKRKIESGTIGNSVNLSKIHGSVEPFEEGGKPVIVPPTWNKTQDKLIRPQWQLAHKLLQEAEQIIFIGYSLPKTDVYVKYLLINGLEASEKLKRIVVVNPDDDGEVRKRYEAFFEQHFREKSFRFHAMRFSDWVESKYFGSQMEADLRD